MTNKPIKEQIRDIIKTATCRHCASVNVCKSKQARCGAFIPSAELYEEIAVKCKEVK